MQTGITFLIPRLIMQKPSLFIFPCTSRKVLQLEPYSENESQCAMFLMN